MSMNRQGRQTQPQTSTSSAQETHSGNRGLQIEEPLLFEIGGVDQCGVDLPEPADACGDIESCFGDLARSAPMGLAGLSEPEAMRHYVRLSQKNYSIDTGVYPLGSCTMKHNPRLNEKIARLPGFMDIHPLQPQSTVPGALELMKELSRWLLALTGMQAVSLAPRAGAHGELCGMMAIRAALEASGQGRRNIVLVPDSAHGTNPASAALVGCQVRSVAAQKDGTVTADSVRAALDENVAAIMLTNPNTGGVFEREIVEIAEAVHQAGGYFYCDGANLNAIAAKVRPGDLGVDAMHINLHKTFSTPHGGGGPGAGPVVFSKALARYAPTPAIQTLQGEPVILLEQGADGPPEFAPFGRMTAFHGQWGMLARAFAYMLSHGGDGLRQASEDAVLNANYLRARLSDHMSLAFGEDHVCMHEVLFDDAFLKDTGVATLDFAKAMIDEGFHPMTVYFPLIVHGAMLVEPTESESRASLDQFIAVMRKLVAAAKNGDAAHFTNAPRFTPRRRLDETTAARKPVLRWKGQGV